MKKTKGKNKQLYYFNNSGKRISEKKYKSILKGLKTRKFNKKQHIKTRKKATYYYSKKGKRISKKKHDAIEKAKITREINKQKKKQKKYHYQTTNFLSLWDIIKKGNEIFLPDAVIEWDCLDYSFKGNLEENIVNLPFVKLELDKMFIEYGVETRQSYFIWVLDDIFFLRFEGIEGETKSLKITITEEYQETLNEVTKISKKKNAKKSKNRS